MRISSAALIAIGALYSCSRPSSTSTATDGGFLHVALSSEQTAKSAPLAPHKQDGPPLVSPSDLNACLNNPTNDSTALGFRQGTVVRVKGTLKKRAMTYADYRAMFLDGGGGGGAVWQLREMPSACFLLPQALLSIAKEDMRVSLDVVVPECKGGVFVGCRSVDVRGGASAENGN